MSLAHGWPLNFSPSLHCFRERHELSLTVCQRSSFSKRRPLHPLFLLAAFPHWHWGCWTVACLSLGGNFCFMSRDLNSLLAYESPLDQGGNPNLLSALTRKIVSLCEMWLEGIWNVSLGRYCIPGLEPSGLVTLCLGHICLCGVSTKDHWCSLIFHTWILLNTYLFGCWMLFEQFSESSSNLTLSSSCGCFTGHWVYKSLDTVQGL